MSTLAENVAKVVAAHKAIGDALSSKGVDVPEGTKLSGMAKIINGIYSSQTDRLGFITLPKNITMEESLILNLAQYKDSDDYNYLFGSTTKQSANQDIETVSFPEGFGRKATSMCYMFSGCINLKSISFPEGFGQNVTNCSHMFGVVGAASSPGTDIPNLTELTFPDGFGIKATTCGYMFRGLASLKSIHLPTGFGQNATVLDKMFSHCSALTTITGAPWFRASLDLSGSILLTHDSLMVVINNLRSMATKKDLVLGTTNLAKLTDEEKEIATGKGWTLA